MKISIVEQGKIYDTKVLYSSGGSVGVVCNGKVIRRYDPALAKQYIREHREKNSKAKSKKKVNQLTTLPKGMVVLANEVHIHNVKRDIPSLHIKKTGQNKCNCKECMLQIRGECVGNVGERKECDYFKPAPKEELTAKRIRMMI